MAAAVGASQIKRSKVITGLARCHHKELGLFSKSLMDDVRASTGMPFNVPPSAVNIRTFINGSDGFEVVKLR